MNRFYLIALIFMLVGCTIAPPKLYVATQKSAIEKQLLGSFFGSNKIVVDDYSTFIDAFEIQDSQFLKNLYIDSLFVIAQKRFLYVDELDTLLNIGIVNENSTGMLELNRIDSRSHLSKIRVEQIVSFENRNRKNIFKYIAKILNLDYKYVVKRYSELSKNKDRYNE